MCLTRRRARGGSVRESELRLVSIVAEQRIPRESTFFLDVGESTVDCRVESTSSGALMPQADNNTSGRNLISKGANHVHSVLSFNLIPPRTSCSYGVQGYLRSSQRFYYVHFTVYQSL